MKRQKKLWTITRIFLLLLTLVLPWTVQKNVLGAETEKGSITISLDDLGTPKGDVEFTAYYVGDRNKEGEWKLADSLSDTGVTLEGLVYADEWDAAALKLAQGADLESLDSASGKTDETGNLTLSNLTWGMYLVVQNGESAYGTVSPFLAGIPYVEDGGRKNDLTVHPKARIPAAEENGRIEVTKRAGYQDPKLLEVIDLTPANVVYYVGLFQDKQGKIPYGTDYLRKITMQGISTGTAVFENLPAGTYYVFETDSTGNVYKVNEKQNESFGSWVCKLEEGDSQTVTLDGKAESPAGKVGFYNLYYDLPDNFFYFGKLMISKKVLEEEKQTTVSDTFYVGIFRDEKGTDLYEVRELVQNGSIMVEVPLGGENRDGPITYYIYETDKDGNRIDEENFGYTVSGEGKVDFRQGKLEAEISLVNTKKEPETEEPTEEPTEKPTEKTTEKETETKPVKTGDETPIALYTTAILAAFLALIVSIGYLRGRKRHEQ